MSATAIAALAAKVAAFDYTAPVASIGPFGTRKTCGSPDFTPDDTKPGFSPGTLVAVTRIDLAQGA